LTFLIMGCTLATGRPVNTEERKQMAGDGYNYSRVVNATYDLSNMPLWPRLYLQGDYDRATILLSPCHAPGTADPPQAITLAVTMRRADLFSLVYQGSVVMERTMGLSCQQYGEGLEEEYRQRCLTAAAWLLERPAEAAARKRDRRRPAPPVEVGKARIARSRAMLRRVMGGSGADGQSIDAAT
jgi:hypothetical protein